MIYSAIAFYLMFGVGLASAQWKANGKKDVKAYFFCLFLWPAVCGFCVGWQWWGDE